MFVLKLQRLPVTIMGSCTYNPLAHSSSKSYENVYLFNVPLYGILKALLQLIDRFALHSTVSLSL